MAYTPPEGAVAVLHQANDPTQTRPPCGGVALYCVRPLHRPQPMDMELFVDPRTGNHPVSDCVEVYPNGRRLYRFRCAACGDPLCPSDLGQAYRT